jgi:hypothetical protein
LRSIPIGWAIKVDNDASWTTTVSGTLEVGAAALDPEALKAFVAVAETEPDSKQPIKLSGEIIAADLATGSAERRIPLKSDQFKIDKGP